MQIELSVVCLPAPSLAPAVLGTILDLSLDLFLIYRSAKLFRKATDSDQPAEFVVLLSSIALLAWHLVRLFYDQFLITDCDADVV